MNKYYLETKNRTRTLVKADEYNISYKGILTFYVTKRRWFRKEYDAVLSANDWQRITKIIKHD